MSLFSYTMPLSERQRLARLRKPGSVKRIGMPGIYLLQWRRKQGLSKRALARQLEVQPSTITRWEGGQVPRHIALACAAIAHNLPTFGF
jgi:DNA-binding XRE family transcriptional regulator